MQRAVIYLVLFIVVLCYSCGRRPRHVLPEDKMTDVLYDIQLAQAIYRSDAQFNTDERKDALVESVLRKHKISQADLDSSLLWYSDNIEYYMAINDSVASRLRNNSNLAVNARAGINPGRDFSNYLIPPFAFLSQSESTMSFDLDSNKIKTTDLTHFELKFKIIGVNPLVKVESAVFFTYKDTLIRNVISIERDSVYSFTKPNIADSLLTNIAGYIHVDSRGDGLPFDVLFYDVTYVDSLSMQGRPERSSVRRDIRQRELRKSEEKR